MSNQGHRWMKKFGDGPVLAGGGKTGGNRTLSGGAVSLLLC